MASPERKRLTTPALTRLPRRGCAVGAAI